MKSVSEIIAPFYGKKDVTKKRIAALEQAGYTVEFYGYKWNFGTSGTIKETEEGRLVQMSCAVGRTTRKGFRANHCSVYLIK